MKGSGKPIHKIFFATFFVTTIAYGGRPLAIEDAWVASKNQIQLEISWDSSRWSDNLIESIPLMIPYYGITDYLQVSMSIPFVILNSDVSGSSAGLGDLDASMKLLLANPEKWPAVSIMTTIKTRSGAEEKGHGSGVVDVVALLSATLTRSTTMISAMLGHTYSEDHNNLLNYALGVEYGVSKRLTLGAELFGEEHLRKAGIHSISVLGGAAYAVTTTTTLDAGYRVGMTDAAPIWNITAGVSLAF